MRRGRASSQVLRRARLPLAVAMVATVGALLGPLERTFAQTARLLPHPGPLERPPGFDAAKENEACASCHTEIAAEWRGSLHRRAFEDPLFRAAYAVESLAFCRNCHAPETQRAAGPSDGEAEVGVACTSCHLVEGAIVGKRGRSADARGHAVVEDRRVGGAEACAACHEFDFPNHAGAAMQSTISEHAASAYAETSCQDCHMPFVKTGRARGHRSHGFKVWGDESLLRSAVKASARRGTYGTVEVTLEPGRVGHAFPTGDLFRHLVVRARAGGQEAAPVVLARRFASRVTESGGVDRWPIGDDRVPPPGAGAEKVALLRFPDAIDTEVVDWEVAYRRFEDGFGTAAGMDASADEVIVASGRLPTVKKKSTSGSGKRDSRP